MKKLGILLLAAAGLVGLCAQDAHGQGTQYRSDVRSTPGPVVPGATITVCAGTADVTKVPCFPTTPIFQDAGLSVPASNPLQADGDGNYSFYASAGPYVFSITGRGLPGRTFTYTLPCVPLNPNCGGGGGGGSQNIYLSSYQGTITGAINGSNTTFTFSQTSLSPQNTILTLNGVTQAQGIDYTLAGGSIVTMAIAPQATDYLAAWINTSNTGGGGSGVNLLPLNNIWTGSANTFNNQVFVGGQFNAAAIFDTQLILGGFVCSTPGTGALVNTCPSGSPILASNNTFTGTNNFTQQTSFPGGIGANCFSGPSPWIDPVCYGADPNGFVDSTSAITAAIAAECATGGPVNLPAGNFKVTQAQTGSSAIDAIFPIPAGCNSPNGFQISGMGNGYAATAQFEIPPTTRITVVPGANPSMGPIFGIGANTASAHISGLALVGYNQDIAVTNTAIAQIDHVATYVQNTGQGIQTGAGFQADNVGIAVYNSFWVWMDHNVFGNGGMNATIPTLLLAGTNTGGRSNTGLIYVTNSIFTGGAIMWDQRAPQGANPGNFVFRDITVENGGTQPFFTANQEAAGGGTLGQIEFTNIGLSDFIGSPSAAIVLNGNLHYYDFLLKNVSTASSSPAILLNSGTMVGCDMQGSAEANRLMVNSAGGIVGGCTNRNNFGFDLVSSPADTAVGTLPYWTNRTFYNGFFGANNSALPITMIPSGQDFSTLGISPIGGVMVGPQNTQAGYDVEYHRAGDRTAAIRVAQTSAPSGVAATTAGGGTLTIGQPYYVIVETAMVATTCLTANLTGPSLEVSATPTTGNQTLAVTWSAVTGTPAVGYCVYWGTAPVGENQFVYVAGAASTSVNITSPTGSAGTGAPANNTFPSTAQYKFSPTGELSPCYSTGLVICARQPFPGETIDVSFNACVAAAILVNGTCDARSLPVTATVGATLVAGDSAGDKVSVLMPPACTWTVTITNASDVMDVYAGADVRANSPGGSPNCLIQSSSGTNSIGYLFYLNQSSTQGYSYVEGLKFSAISPATASANNIGCLIYNTFDQTTVKNFNCSDSSGDTTALMIQSMGFGGRLDNVYGSCRFASGCTPIEFLTSGSQDNDVVATDLNADYPGAGQPNVTFADSFNGSSTAHIYGFYGEGSTGSTTAVPIAFNGMGSVEIYGGRFVCKDSPCTGALASNTNNGNGQIVMDGLLYSNGGAQTKAFSNSNGRSCWSAPTTPCIEYTDSKGFVNRIQTEPTSTSSASPAVCASAQKCAFVIASGASSVVVDDTQTPGDSGDIRLTFDSTIGTRLGVTCNTAPQAFGISAITPGVSYTVTSAANFSTNPGCFTSEIRK